MPKRKNRTPKFTKPHRNNAGVILPQFVLHAALQPMVLALKKGQYGKGSLEEPLVKVVGNMTQRLIDQCLAALQKRPPTVSLSFPLEPSFLPWITIATDDISAEALVMDDFVGAVDEEIHLVEDAFEITPRGGAAGGESVFHLPKQDIVTSMVDLAIVRAGTTMLIYQDGDYDVEGDGEITLSAPLLAGDVLRCVRYAHYGLPGGDLYGSTFRFNHTILIDTVNPVVTSFLAALVWRELMLQETSILRSGLVDPVFGIRSNSIWTQVQPAIAHRIEFTVSGLTNWQVYSRQTAVREVSLDLGVTDQQEQDLGHFEMQFDINTWGDEEGCGE